MMMSLVACAVMYRVRAKLKGTAKQGGQWPGLDDYTVDWWYVTGGMVTRTVPAYRNPPKLYTRRWKVQLRETA